MLSKERNPVVAVRFRKLDLPCHQGVDDKLPRLIEILADLGVAVDAAPFAGNDANDLERLSHVGLPTVVADAQCDVRRRLRHTGVRRPGRGSRGM